LIRVRSRDIIANTSRMWIKWPMEKMKNPNNHPIIRITASRYKKLLMIAGF
jgi:hypothetical protein